MMLVILIRSSWTYGFWIHNLVLSFSTYVTSSKLLKLPLSSVWNGNINKRKCKLLSHVRLFATPWTIQSMEFSRPEYWSGKPFPSPGDLPKSGIESRSPTLHMDSLATEPQGKSKNTGVDSLSLFQQIFPTQESNHSCIPGGFFTKWAIRERLNNYWSFHL